MAARVRLPAYARRGNITALPAIVVRALDLTDWRDGSARPPVPATGRRVLLPRALQGLDPAGDALEIGGSGAMAAQLLAQYPVQMLTVTDSDAGMVTPIGKIIAAFPGRATVQQVDTATLPFADARFDVVLS
jgi:hypothetical protein